MDGFIAALPSSGEERIVRRDGSELKKLFRKVVLKQTSAKEVHEDTVVETRTVYLVKGGLSALAAFHTEKEKARAEGFSIQSFDSMSEDLLEKKPHQDFLQRKRKFLGRFVKE